MTRYIQFQSDKGCPKADVKACYFFECSKKQIDSPFNVLIHCKSKQTDSF